MQIIIRNANVDDYRAIAKLNQNDLGYEACSEELVKNKLLRLDNSREAVFIAEIEGRSVGYVHIEKYDSLYFEPIANIMSLAVEADFRRNGIGQKLLKAAENWAVEKRAAAVRINSSFSRNGAHEFYRMSGYNSEKQQLRFLKYF